MDSFERDKFETFLSSLSGDKDYEKKLKSAYPNANFLFLPPDPLPVLSSEECLSCDCGCGGESVIGVPYATVSVCGVDGVTDARIALVWASPCTLKGNPTRHHGMTAFNPVTGHWRDILPPT